MRNEVKSGFIVALLQLAVASPAIAITHTFDFRDLTSPYQMTPDIQTLYVTSDNGLQAAVDGQGTATCTPPATACANDGRLLQGLNGIGVFDTIIGDRESITVSIAPITAFLLQSVVLENGAGAGDYLDIFVDNVLATSYRYTDGVSHTLDLSVLGLTGSVFRFAGRDSALSGSPMWTLTSLTVRTQAQVPEPGTLALLGLGLLGLGLSRRRKPS